MQKTCHHCAKLVPLDAKFCSHCGTNLSSLANTPTKSIVPSKSKTPSYQPVMVGGRDEDDDYIDHIEHLDIRQNELQVEIISPQIGGEKIGTAMLAGAQMGPPDASAMKPRQGEWSDLDKKGIEQKFREEAGAMRPNERMHTVQHDEK